MARISDRFRLIEQIQTIGKGHFAANEGIAFQLRKIIEGVAFGCVVSSELGTKIKIRNARGHWNAKHVFNELAKKGCLTLPNPSVLRAPLGDELQEDIKWVIEGLPRKCLTKQAVIEIYERTHVWLHEINPFYSDSKKVLTDNEDMLWQDSESLLAMLERHFIAVQGEGFYCTLFDIQTGTTKVLPLSRPPEYAQTH